MIVDNILRLEERVTMGIDVGESHFREFKSAWVQNPSTQPTPRNVKDICQDVGETLVAFANADGGDLLVGVEDDGTITGVPHKEELVNAIKRAHGEYVHCDSPLPAPAVGDIEIDGKRVLYFSVVKSMGLIHLTSSGRCLRRYDRENRPAVFEEIRAARGESISREYDRSFVDGVNTGDLDIDLLTYVADQMASGFSAEKLMQYLGLAEYGDAGLRYRKAALLLFAKDISRWYPRCEVRIIRVRGTELGAGENYNVINDERISDSIPKLVEDAWDSLRPHLARTRFQSTGIFRESLIYPEFACREALVNAIAHRDYSREGSPIEIFVYDDRMEFRSPGALLSGISIDQLKELAQVHETRNVLVARTLRELGLMREMGEGILRMFGAMRASELVDPELTSDREQFVVTLRSQSIFNRQDIAWLESYKEFELEKNEQRVVLMGRDGHLLSTNDIVKVTEIVDIDDFRALYEQLRRKGIIYNAKPRLGGGGGKRNIGRFQVRPSHEAEQFLGEMIVAIKALGPNRVLTRDAVSAVRSKLSPSSPFKDRPDYSLQLLGFVDSQRRFLPKALSYVPELEDMSPSTPHRLFGQISEVKPAGYGFITADDGTSYFLHPRALSEGAAWDSAELNTRVSFVPGPPSNRGLSDPAQDVRFV